MAKRITQDVGSSRNTVRFDHLEGMAKLRPNHVIIL